MARGDGGRRPGMKTVLGKVDSWSRVFVVRFLVPPLAALSILAQTSISQSSSPDLVLFNARVVTMNEKQPSAQAIAIRGQRITWVGNSDEGKQLYPSARALDLQGATVLPGLTDAHGHLINLGESLVRLNLKDIPTEKEIVERVKQR